MLSFVFPLIFLIIEDAEEKESSKTEKHEIEESEPRQRPRSMIEPYEPSVLMRDFDRGFENFRWNFETLLW